MSNEYNRDFQMYLIEHAFVSAKKVIPFVFDIFKPESVADFGCGTGSWLYVAKEWMHNQGNENSVILGLDGDYIERDILKISEDEFRAVDLTKPICLGRKFDVAISLEVAEHLESQYADTFVDSICAASDVVLFSAAMPGQWGVHHVNEQLLSYWIEKFAARGYECFDIVRPEFWFDKEVDLDYRQNCVIFAHGSRDNNQLKAMEKRIIDIAHPEFLEGRTKAWRYWMDKVEYIQEKHRIIAWVLKKVWKRFK